jgi:hypothetical protein
LQGKCYCLEGQGLSRRNATSAYLLKS